MDEIEALQERLKEVEAERDELLKLAVQIWAWPNQHDEYPEMTAGMAVERLGYDLVDLARKHGYDVRRARVVE